VGGINLIRKIGERIKHPSLKEQIAQAIFRLDEQREKLEHMTNKLQQKDKELFHRCIEAQISKDDNRTRVYANECGEVRKIAKIVLTSQISLERVILRLQTIESLGEVLGQVYPVINVVRETKDRITNVIPDVAHELDQVNEMLTDMSLEAVEVAARQIIPEMAGEEAIKVLKESAAIAEEMMKEKFPEPRLLPTRERNSKVHARVVLEGAGNQGSLEDLIFTYLRENNGKPISISKCARQVGVSVYAVRKAMTRLAEAGRIELEQ